jgi:hypothetical protein
MRQQSANVRGAMEWNMTPEQANWVVVEIRDGNGALRAITNPIFLQSNP